MRSVAAGDGLGIGVPCTAVTGKVVVVAVIVVAVFAVVVWR